MEKRGVNAMAMTFSPCKLHYYPYVVFFFFFPFFFFSLSLSCCWWIYEWSLSFAIFYWFTFFEFLGCLICFCYCWSCLAVALCSLVAFSTDIGHSIWTIFGQRLLLMNWNLLFPFLMWPRKLFHLEHPDANFSILWHTVFAVVRILDIQREICAFDQQIHGSFFILQPWIQKFSIFNLNCQKLYFEHPTLIYSLSLCLINKFVFCLKDIDLN